MDEHAFERVEHDGGAFVLVCCCGWRSGSAISAGVVCGEWDQHRHGAVADAGHS